MKQRSILILGTLTALAISLAACRMPSLVPPPHAVSVLEHAPAAKADAPTVQVSEPNIHGSRATTALDESLSISTDGSWSGVGTVRNISTIPTKKEIIGTSPPFSQRK